MQDMAPRTRWYVFLISTPIVALVTIGGMIGTPRAAPQQSFSHLRVFEDVISLVMNAYVETVDIDKVMDGAMRGLADSLDTSSAYLLPEEVRALENKAPLPAGDVGLVVTRQYYLRILGVRDGSPAAKAGLQSSDYIRMIDQTPTRDMSGLTGTRLLRGVPGTKVALTIIRGGNLADPHVITLTREAISGDAVRVATVDGVAHVRVTTFSAGTADALGQVFSQLAASKAPGAVIDLRGVADGTPEDGIKAARKFVKTGTLAVRAGRAGAPVKVEAAAGDGTITLPIVLLVSNGTSNAAEVFSAALSGNKRADLVGQPTAGVAAVQRLVKLPEGFGLWMTYERYMSVDGAQPIHERGLPPTVGVAMPLVGFDELPPATDEPLAKAIAHLKSLR
jgi:carboxyl-terminal processing protease